MFCATKDATTNQIDGKKTENSNTKGGGGAWTVDREAVRDTLALAGQGKKMEEVLLEEVGEEEERPTSRKDASGAGRGGGGRGSSGEEEGEEGLDDDDGSKAKRPGAWRAMLQIR